jgi:MazG family protein
MTEQLTRLLDIMARLRDPESGCPWDVKQTYATIAPYTIEEAYEVADAIAAGDMAALREELGDLLLQVVFHARIAEEGGDFDFGDVANAIADKMVRRHPHVFGGADIADAPAQRVHWETLKAAERAAKAKREGRQASVLDGVPSALPALMRAEKLGRRAALVGFEWPDIDGALAKLDEEVAELKAEVATADAERLRDEIGDVLFSVVNVARHLKIDPETALRGANAKFERRFHAVEAGLAAEGTEIGAATLDEMEAHWRRAKRDSND